MSSSAVAKVDIRRMWGDLQVLDADHDLLVFADPEDIADAERGDPGNCAFARSCRRLFKSQKVMFYRSVAYLDLPEEDGTRIVRRFLMTPGMRTLIEIFDLTGNAPAGGFRLKAPRPSQRLDSGRKARNQRRDYKKERRQAESRRRELRGSGQVADPLTMEGVRNGSGQVHFVEVVG